MPAGDKSWFQDLIDRTNWNLSAYTECSVVKDAAEAMLSLGNMLWYWGESPSYYGMYKEYMTTQGGGHAIIFDEPTIRGQDSLALETFLEEAAHFAADPPTIDPATGDTLAVDTAFALHSYDSAPGPTGFRADFAGKCGKLPVEEEEDEPGGEDPGTTETCTDIKHPPLTTTVPVWIPPGNCPDSQTEATSCDFDTGFCPGMHVRTCPGRWVDQVVVLRKAYTERVCTSN